MNIGTFYDSDLGRRLYQEIGMIEEQHVTQYGALLDPGMTWLENLLLHEYTECYLYWSCVEDETDLHIKKIWKQHFEQECSHLHAAEALLKQYEGKEACQIIPDGDPDQRCTLLCLPGCRLPGRCPRGQPPGD